MTHIDLFDGSRDPMVHLRLFSDILRPMGLTPSPEVVTIRPNHVWDSHNLIEVTTRDPEVTRHEPKDGFSEFVTG
ncbi:hypothetical protein ACSBR1_006845 [Camellia fascicularis]